VAYHNAYCLYDPKSGSRFSDDLSLHTLELPKVGDEDEHTELWAWLEFLKAKNEEELEMLAREYPAVQPAVRKLIRLSADERARALFESREKARRDALSWQYEAREEGRSEERQAIARKMLELGIPVEQIMLATGLSREAVREAKD
jgi:predicted transposase/invertase (TIGR01784 family)